MMAHDIRPAAAHRRNGLESLELHPLKEWWEDGLKKVQRP